MNEVLAFKRTVIPRSRFRGVYAFRSRVPGVFVWQCSLSIDERRREHLGTFMDEVAAARAFDVRARALGRSSECNFDGAAACNLGGDGAAPGEAHAQGRRARRREATALLRRSSPPSQLSRWAI